MTTVYEINAPNCHVQVAKDLIFGWCMNVNDEGFIPLTTENYTEHQFDLVISLFSSLLYPDELKQHLRQQRDAARRKKKEAVPA